MGRHDMNHIDEEVGLIPLACLKRSPAQPRPVRRKSQKYLDLLKSVRASGVMERLVVRPAGNDEYEILSGHRRAAAAKDSGLDQVPCIVMHGISDEQAVDMVMCAFIGREDLTLAEEAAAVEDWMERLGGDVKAVASRLGWSERAVRLRINLRNLSMSWQQAIEEDGGIVAKLTPGHLDLIACMPEHVQDSLLGETWRLCKDNSTPITLRQLEKVLAEKSMSLQGAKWDVTDERICPKDGACTSCQKRSSCTPGLFDDQEPGQNIVAEPLPPGDRCLDADCWARKMKAWVKRREKELKAEHPGLVKIRRGSYQQKAYARGLHTFQYEPTKKKDKGAVPAMNVDTNPGALSYVKVKRESESRSRTPKAAVRTIAQARKDMARDREHKLAQLICEQIWDARKGAPALPVPPLDTLLRLVILFGASGGAWRRDIAKDWNKTGGMGQDELLAHIWAQCCESIYEDFYDPAEAIWLAGVLKLDLAALKAKAAELIKEPEEWAGLEDSDKVPLAKQDKAPRKGRKRARKKTAS